MKSSVRLVAGFFLPTTAGLRQCVVYLYEVLDELSDPVYLRVTLSHSANEILELAQRNEHTQLATHRCAPFCSHG